MPTAARGPWLVACRWSSSEHAKVIGAWGEGRTALDVAGCSGAGVVRGDSATEVLATVQEQMSFHRVWERFGGMA